VATVLATHPARLRSIEGGYADLLSARQVAARLGVCTRTVYALTERGKLPHIRISNAIRIDPQDLDAFIAARRSRPQ
jgi:excisionase family DNA binding protein